MKQGSKCQILIYLITLVLVGLIMAFSFYIKDKRQAFNVLDKVLISNKLKYQPDADSNIVFSYLKNESIKNCKDSSLYKEYFLRKESKCNKIQRFYNLMYRVSLHFSHSLIHIKSYGNIYEVELLILASKKINLSLFFDKKNYKLIRADGIESIIGLYCKSLNNKNNL